jgi:L-rhamnose mutarotase
MERVCLVMTLRPGSEAEYDRRHDEIWPELVSEIRNSGVERFTLFRHALMVVAYLECRPDAEVALGKLDGSEVAMRWEKALSGLLEPSSLRLTEVWNLS